MPEFSRRVQDHGFLPSQSPLKDDLQQLYARSISQTDEIVETLRGVNDTQLMILSELQTLEHLSTRPDSVSEVISLTKEHLEKMAKILYTTNGYDEKGVKIPEGVLRFERWTNFLGQAFWNFLVAGLISALFYQYTTSKNAMAEVKTKAELAVIQRMESMLIDRDQKIELLMRQNKPKK